AMQRAMADVNEAHAQRGLPRFEMGVGINTGEAVVGNIGSEQRAKYAVVGAAVNLAARVEGCTVGGQIFLSPHTYARVRDLVEVALHDTLPLLTNLRVRLNYPELGYDSGDLYGKVIGTEQQEGTPVTRIRLTSIDPVDQQILETFFES